MLRVISAKVFGPQNDEAWSIMHVVNAEQDGQKVYCHLMATDPMDAIQKAQGNTSINWTRE